jgi:hypothetical protein
MASQNHHQILRRENPVTGKKDNLSMKPCTIFDASSRFMHKRLKTRHSLKISSPSRKWWQLTMNAMEASGHPSISKAELFPAKYPPYQYICHYLLNVDCSEYNDKL